MAIQCPRCEGSGQVDHDYYFPDKHDPKTDCFISKGSFGTTKIKCKPCNGTGRLENVSSMSCPLCGGKSEIYIELRPLNLDKIVNSCLRNKLTLYKLQAGHQICPNCRYGLIYLGPRNIVEQLTQALCKIDLEPAQISATLCHLCNGWGSICSSGSIMPNETTTPACYLLGQNCVITCPTCNGRQLIYDGKPSLIIELLSGVRPGLFHYQFRPTGY